MSRRSAAPAPICLWWIGADSPPEGALDDVRAHVERVYGLAARLWQGPARPLHAFDPARGQLSSTRILEWLLDVGPGDARKLVGVTDMDLFIPVLTFVFGEAQLGGRVSVVSTARLMPSGGPQTNGRLLVARLAKEAVHEIGHSFGLVHCDEVRCVMSRSASLIDVDTKNGGFCHDCWTRYLDLREATEGTHE